MLLESYAPLFRRGAWVRFVQWVTAMVQCGEEHTIAMTLLRPIQFRSAPRPAWPPHVPVAVTAGVRRSLRKKRRSRWPRSCTRTILLPLLTVATC